MRIEKGRHYKTKSGDVCEIVSLPKMDKKDAVIVKFQGNHPFSEYTTMDEAFFPECKVGLVGFTKSDFEKLFTPTAKRKFWTDDELFVAFMYAKFDTRPFVGTNERRIVESFDPPTTIKSLYMQVAQMRYILDISGYTLRGASPKKYDLAYAWNKMTFTQAVRKLNGILKLKN